MAEVYNIGMYIINVHYDNMNKLGASKIENKILEQAIKKFNYETGLRLFVVQSKGESDSSYIAPIAKIEGYPQEFTIEIKRWAPQANLGVLINQVKSLPLSGILVADYINPSMSEKLRHHDVQFIDGAGNAYINQPPLYVFIRGNRNKLDNSKKRKEKSGRAFAATGLKVIYAILCNPNLINASYREIARIAGVALGTISWVFNDLIANQLIIDRGIKNQRHINDFKRLLDRWVESYPEKLRPKQKVGIFTTNDPNWWKKVDIERYGAFWGGEIAAAKYTGYLKPEIVTIYLPEVAGNKLLADGKLRKQKEQSPSKHYMVEIYRPFWANHNGQKNEQGGLVHPILVYADLIASMDTRNHETAGIVYEQYISQYIK